MPIIIIQEDKWTKSARLEPDKRIYKIPVYEISWEVQMSIVTQSLIQFHKLRWIDTDYARAVDFFAPQKFILIFSIRRHITKAYWWFVWRFLCDRLHLIKIELGYEFHWKQNFIPLQFILKLVGVR